MVERSVNDELEKMWNEKAMAYFKVLPWHLHERNAENHKNSLSIRTYGLWVNIHLQVQTNHQKVHNYL
jgi:hypothetical protein